jgi:hypothetical protein
MTAMELNSKNKLRNSVLIIPLEFQKSRILNFEFKVADLNPESPEIYRHALSSLLTEYTFPAGV